MLEWMHDPDAVRYMRADFSGMTLADCERFIAAAQQDTPSLHRAVADGAGVYQGTVSLKNCDAGRGEAEFAIAVRRCAMGHGCGRMGNAAILQLGFSQLGLRPYLLVRCSAECAGLPFLCKAGIYPPQAGAGRKRSALV